jgi:hypothetical protein
MLAYTELYTDIALSLVTTLTEVICYTFLLWAKHSFFTQEKLAVVELSRDVVRNNAGENQAILIQVRQNLCSLREEIEEKRRQVETMKRQLQASTR